MVFTGLGKAAAGCDPLVESDLQLQGLPGYENTLQIDPVLMQGISTPEDLKRWMVYFMEKTLSRWMTTGSVSSISE